MGIEQLKKCNFFQHKRSLIAKKYNYAFSSLPVILPPQSEKGDVHSWHLYVIQLDDSVLFTRNEFIERLFDLGIGCSVHYIPLHLQPYWRDTYKLNSTMFPISQKVFERSVSLPIHTRMSESDIERVIMAVKKLLC